MNGRGMKKWAPYASLIEQKGTVSNMKHNRGKMAKPHLSQDQANHLNQLLMIIADKKAKIIIFNDGKTLTLSGMVTKVNFDEKWLVLNDQRIPFQTMLSIQMLSPIKAGSDLYTE